MTSASPRLVSLIAAGMVHLGTIPKASAEPTTDVSKYEQTIVIKAGTPWDSPVRLGEVCDFDLRVVYDDTVEVTTFDDGHQVIAPTFRDEYTNLQTQLSFVDTARYYIRFDSDTGLAYHSGIFWKVLFRGNVVALDVGTFEQNWNAGPYPWPVTNLTGKDHDVNGKPFGTLSYCEWALGHFPRHPEDDNPHDDRDD